MKQEKAEKPKKAKHPKSGKLEIARLTEELDIARKEKNEFFEKLQRVSADYANFQKRVSKQIADTISYEKEKLMKTLLPALDNFEHTLQGAHSAEDVEVMIKGVQIINDQLLDIVKLHGVEQIESLGENFDPSLHQAMLQSSDVEKKDGIVLEEFQKGYKLNGRVIRPSKVVVNKLPEDEEAELPDTEDESNENQTE